MATHSSVLAWRIPGMGEPGGLPSLGSRRVGHDWSDLAAAAAAVTICSDFGVPQNKVSHCFHCFPIYLLFSNGTRCMILVFWTLSFNPTFSLSSFTFIKRLLSSLLSAIRMVSSACLRLLIFLPAILIPACALSSPAFLLMCSVYVKHAGWQYKALTYSFPDLEPVYCSMSRHFQLLLLDLHTDFSGGRSGGLLFPSQEEFSVVCCDPHSQRL